MRSFAISGNTVLLGTDGGLHISTDGSLNFRSAGKWISAIDLWGFSSSFKGDVVASGDDHGPSEIRYADVDRGWVPIGGADSGEIQLNNCNTDYAYGRDVYSRFMAVKKLMILPMSEIQMHLLMHNINIYRKILILILPFIHQKTMCSRSQLTI